MFSTHSNFSFKTLQDSKINNGDLTFLPSPFFRHKKRQSIRETAFKKELKSKKLNQKINYKAKSGLQNQKCKISALRNTDKKKR